MLACQCETVLRLGGRPRRPARCWSILAEYVGSVSVVAVLCVHELTALSRILPTLALPPLPEHLSAVFDFTFSGLLDIGST